MEPRQKKSYFFIIFFLLQNSLTTLIVYSDFSAWPLLSVSVVDVDLHLYEMP